jgi:Rad3-related DNA helicase
MIRTETDHGVVVVLDPRLPQKRYLRELLASLPEIDVLRAAPDEVPAVAAQRLKLLEREPSHAWQKAPQISA